MNFPLWGVIPHNSNASTTPLSPNTVEKTLCQIEMMLEEVYFHYIYLAYTEKTFIWSKSSKCICGKVIVLIECL